MYNIQINKQLYRVAQKIKPLPNYQKKCVKLYFKVCQWD